MGEPEPVDWNMYNLDLAAQIARGEDDPDLFVVGYREELDEPISFWPTKKAWLAP